MITLFTNNQTASKKTYTKLLRWILILGILCSNVKVHAQIVYNTFTQALSGSSTTTQCNDFTNYRATLTRSDYSVLNFRSTAPGSNVFTCTTPAVVQAIANALRTGSSTPAYTTWVDGATTWWIGTCSAFEFGASTIGGSNCICNTGTSYAVLRPCILSSNWGGFNGTCGAANQTITLEFGWNTTPPPVLGPLPSITSLSPIIGASGIIDTINGSNFSTTPSNNIVHYGPARASVLSATSNMLRVSVPFGLSHASTSVTTNGLTAFSPRNFAPTFSNSANLSVNSFAAASLLSMSAPVATALLDVDNDGRIDMVTVDQWSGTLNVNRNTGTTGNLSNLSFTSSGVGVSSFVSTPTDMIASDVDGDGRRDLIICNSGNNTLAIYLNNTPVGGSITSSSFILGTILSTGSTPTKVAAADLDGDGKPDIGVANNGSSSYSIFRNTSYPGTCLFDAPLNIACGSSPRNIAFADIDNDQKQDVLITLNSASSLIIAKNNSTTGSIAFNTFVTFALSNIAQGLDVGDIDGDGRMDVVTSAASISSVVNVFRNAGVNGLINSTSFNTRIDLATATNTQLEVKLAELNGDGRLDIVGASRAGSSIVSIWQNNSTQGSLSSGSFGSRIDFTTSTSPTYLHAGDLDNDGRSDLILNSSSWGSIWVHKNQQSIFQVGALPQSTYGTGSTIGVPFATTLSFNPGNVFTAQLSDSSGSFANPSSLGAIIGTVSSTITGTIPTTVPSGSNYRIRVVSSNPSFITDIISSPIRIVIPPVISNITPLSGSVGTVVTITGSNFSQVLSENKVYFGPVAATVLSATATTLTAQVPITSTIAPVSVNVLSFSANSSQLFSPTFTGTNALSSATFGTGVNFASGAITQPMNVELCDVDTDGRTDIVVPNNGPTTPTNNSVFRNTAVSGSITTSSLASRLTYTAAGNAWQTQTIDIDGDGRKEMISVNSSTSVLSVHQNAGSSGVINFNTRVDFTLPSNGTGVSYGDLDGDGRMDVVTANFSTNNISVFRNIGSLGTINTSSFASRQDITCGVGPVSVLVQDIDMDGKPDVVLALASPTNTLSVLRNTSTIGNISFASAVNFTVQNNPRSLALGDINADGKPEILVTNQNSGTLSVFQNISIAGTINLGTRLDITTGTGPWGVATGDMDGDGKVDIAVANLSSNNITLIPNIYSGGAITSGSFGTTVTLTVGSGSSQPNGVAIADIDGDGRPELIVTQYGGNALTLYPNTTGLFAPSAAIGGSYCAGNTVSIPFTATSGFSLGNVFTAQLVDMSNNAVTNIGSAIGTTSGTISATIPNGLNSNSTFRIQITSTNPALTSSLSVNAIRVLNCPTITSVTPVAIGVGNTVTITGTNFSTTPSNNVVYYGGVRATVNSSTATQLVTTLPNGVAIRHVAVNVGGATAQNNAMVIPTFAGGNASFTSTLFGSRITVPAINSVVGCSLGDLDGDGRNDLVAGVFGSASISVYRNLNTISGSLSSSTFASRQDFATPSSIQFTRLADIDGDGRLDVLAASSGGNAVHIFRNTSTVGNITFATRIDLTTGNNPVGVAAVDLDADGKLDIVTGNFVGNSISIFKNLSTNPGSLSASSFGTRVDITGISQAQGVAFGDLNLDGRMDLLVGLTSGSSITILINNTGIISTSMFSSFTLSTGSGPRDVMMMDLDGDGKLDIVSSNQTSGNLSVYRNVYVSGTMNASSFTLSSSLATSSGSYGLTAGDMDGDGKPDLLSVSSSGGTVSVYRNISTSGAISFDTRFDIASTNGSTYQIDAADMDDDGRPDIAVSGYGNGAIYVWKNTLPTFSVGSIATGPYCTGSSISVPFTTPSGMFGLGNVFTAQLSDSAGSFSNPSNIGSFFGTNGGTIAATLPVNIPSGTRYRIRVISTSPVATTLDNGSNILINACPSITNISPLTGAPGSNITITGSNFSTNVSANMVYMGAAQATVLTASSTSLSVRIPLGAMAAPVSLTIGNYTTSSTQTFTPTFAGNGTISTSTMSSRADVVTSLNTVRPIGLNDLDNDGKIDLHAGVSGSGTYNVYRNIATVGSITSGSLGTLTSLSVPQPWNEAVADFDNDGRQDIAAVSYSNNLFSVFRNQSISGSIVFGSSTGYVTGTTPHSIAAGDIDGDGKVDLAVANLGSNTITLHMNTTVGNVISFGAGVSFTVPNQPSSIIVNDIDGDGKPDVAVTNFGSNQISYFRNIASSGAINTSSLASRVDITCGTAPFFMSAMDVDADGKIDLIVPNFSGNNFSVFRNTSSVGNISFAARVDITTPSGPTSVALGDMDGDGKIDVATVNQTAGNVALFKNTGTTGTISFGTGVNFSTLSSPIAAAIGDIDGDGRPDLAVTSSVGNAISVFRNMNIAPEPTLQATGVSVSSITNTSMQVSWTNGNGSGRLVLARAGSAVTNDPVDENWYTASAAFGSGTQIGSGNFVLHAGSANNVVVTGLSPVSTYHYKVYEYNGTLGATNYLITSAPIGNATTLPVSLIYFGVTQSGREALLTWATSSEQNNMGFVVERSMDMQTWDYLGFVSGSGNSMEVRNYQYRDGISDWMDKHAVIYYRLRQQDMDGREEILPVKKLTLGMQSKAESLAYPNPATTYVILQSGWQLNGTEKSYRIVDIMGKEVRSKQAMSSTTQVVSLDGLQEGIYFIEMQDTMGNTQRLKVVKE